jgi:hypothetical protein
MLTVGRSPRGMYRAIRLTLNMKMRITQIHFRFDCWRLIKSNINRSPPNDPWYQRFPRHRGTKAQSSKRAEI